MTDTDGDGLVNIFDTDNGGTVLAVADTDGDGLRNYIDLDSDNDLMPDAIEANAGVLPANMNSEGQFTTLVDTDGDGFHNDRDSSNGGTAFAIPNSDGNGPVDYLDLDSDNDGIPDVIENGGIDANGDGFVDSFVDTDNDGLHDGADAGNGGTAAVTGGDKDGDGILNYRDLDSDNDGITDIIEAGGVDTNGDGVADNLTDTDGDGWVNIFDTDNGGTALTVPDTDGDGLRNFLDLDSDNDLMPDAIEANAGVLPANMNSEGQFTALVDTDGDGFHNDRDSSNGGTAYVLTNSDGDGSVDYLDLDSDNDGIPDVIENGGIDANGDGFVDSFVDTDNDGLHDGADAGNGGTAAVTGGDKDGDGFLNYRDADSDNDGIADIIEGGGVDTNGDGVADDVTDTDGDGLSNIFDLTNGGTALPVPDTDGDGLRNFLDLDSDNDGIVDAIEANDGINLPAGMNDNGQYITLVDTDGDGMHNNVDTSNGGTALLVPNTDSPADVLPDYIDLDSDNDGAPDAIEGFDDNRDGDANFDLKSRAATFETANANPGKYTTTDTDADNIPDWLEDDDSDGVLNFLDPDHGTFYFDTDNDGIVDLYDSNQNGASFSSVSGVPDNDTDSSPNQLDSDDAITLPLDFLDFTGINLDGGVALQWITTNEVNVSHFEIEHSIDGTNFSTFGKVDAVNEKSLINTYDFTHLSPIEGFNYYRVTEFDFDGLFESSSIISVLSEEIENLKFELFPNPSSNYINISSRSNVPVIVVHIMNMNGAIIHHEVIKSTDLGVDHEIDISSFKIGIYHVIMQSEEKRYQYKIIKE